MSSDKNKAKTYNIKERSTNTSKTIKTKNNKLFAKTKLKLVSRKVKTKNIAMSLNVHTNYLLNPA